MGKSRRDQASAEETDRLNKKIYHMMAENCGHHKDYFLDIVHDKGHADWFWTDECKKHNLANHLHIPEFKMKPKSSSALSETTYSMSVTKS